MYGVDIVRACEVLRGGGIILYPTDTVWGIGCDAADSTAVRRIYEIKRRVDSKALILLVADGDMMRAHAAPLPDVVSQMIANPDERPTTMVIDGGRDLAPEVLAADGSVGMRIRARSLSALCAVSSDVRLCPRQPMSVESLQRQIFLIYHLR